MLLKRSSDTVVDRAFFLRFFFLYFLRPSIEAHVLQWLSRLPCFLLFQWNFLSGFSTRHREHARVILSWSGATLEFAPRGEERAIGFCVDFAPTMAAREQAGVAQSYNFEAELLGDGEARIRPLGPFVRMRERRLKPFPKSEPVR